MGGASGGKFGSGARKSLGNSTSDKNANLLELRSTQNNGKDMTANVSPENSEEEVKYQKYKKAVGKKILGTKTQALAEESLLIESF